VKLGSKIWKLGQVLEKVGIRQYKVVTEQGGQIIRNRQYLRKTKEKFPEIHDYDWSPNNNQDTAPSSSAPNIVP